MIGSERNSVKNISQERIQTFIEIQNASDRMLKLRTPIKKLHAKLHNKNHKFNFMRQMQKVQHSRQYW